MKSRRRDYELQLEIGMLGNGVERGTDA